MGNIRRRQDRTARLLKLQMLLCQHPEGLYVTEIAKLCTCNERTIYRDLVTLESELGVPVWGKGSKRGIVEGYFLPPIHFTLTEAMSILMAMRLMQKYFYHDPSEGSTFLKLYGAVPSPLKKYFEEILNVTGKPINDSAANNFNKLAQAWLTKRKVKIQYKRFIENDIIENTVEIYFIEPLAERHSRYVVAYCPLEKRVKTYKVERIVGDIEILADTYEIPNSFNATDYLNSAWGIYADRDVETVRVRFNAKNSDVIFKNVWHPSQHVELQPDGSIIATFKVRDILGLRLWLMGLGYDFQVLEPETLRKEVVNFTKSILCLNCFENPDCAEFWKYNNEALKMEITDKQWEKIRTLLPPSPSRGRPRTDERKLLNGVLWKLKTGSKWADIPQSYGAVSTCHTRWSSWKSLGVWGEISSILLNTEENRITE
jgi:predicted DNA-binding transcriptional regulator YafY